MNALTWNVKLDFSDAIRQADAAVSAIAAKAGKGSSAASMDTSKAEASVARLATAAERAASRESAAWRKAADDAVWATENQAAKQEKAYQRAADEAVRAAEQAATAQRQLNALAAGTAGEKASSAYSNRESEIKRLLAVTGDQVAADKALKLAQQDVARSLVQVGAAGGVAAKGSGKAGAAVGMLGMQLSDVASQLATGTNPLTILIQQGPQVAWAIDQGGGATAIFAQSMRWLSASAATAAAALPPVALGITVLVGAYSSYANATMTAESQAYDLNETIYQQGLTAGTTEQEVAALQKAWEGFTSTMQDAQTYVATVNGDLEDWEVKAGKAARAVIDGSKAQIASEAQHIASLKEQKAAVQGLIDSEQTSSRDLPTLFARRKALNSQIEASVPALEEHKKAVDDTVASVLAAAQAEENERNEKKGQTKASKDYTDALKEEDDWLRRLNAAMAEENRIALENEKAYKAAISGMDEVGAAATRRSDKEKSAAELVLDAYEDQIKKLKELQLAASVASVGEATAEAERAAARNRVVVEQAMQAKLSDIRELAGMDALAQMVEVEKKQQEILAKGARDSAEIATQKAKATRDAMVDLAGEIVSGIGAIAGLVLDITSSAASAAFAEVDRLRSLIEGLGVDTVDAATLSGKALVKAYESGSVAAEDLTEAQRVELERSLKVKEKAAQKEANIQKEAAMQAWEVSQAASYAQALVQGSLAIVNALATMPYPAAPIAAAAAGVAAGVEIASIASAEPPSFRGGGVITDAVAPGGNFLPDMRIIAGELGEAITTRRGTQTLGGEEGVRRINAGIPPAPVEVNLKLRHQTLEKVIAENVQRPGTLRSLTLSLPRRNPYLGR